MNQFWLIYCHKNKINNKCYIGLTHHTKNPNKRWRNGSAYLSDHHKIFAGAILKYGWDNFEHIILEDNIPTLEEANLREKYWIEQYRTYVGFEDSCGYNATLGGDGVSGQIISEYQKECIRSAHLGKKASEETKQKMSKTRKGKPQHMTQKKIDQINSMHKSWKGRHQSEEVKQRIREAGLGRKHSNESKQKMSERKKKQILCVELNRIFLGYDSVIKFTGEKYHKIHDSIYDTTGTKTAGGYHWKYITKEQINAI